MDKPTADYTLAPETPLKGYYQTWPDLLIAEAPAKALCSLAVLHSQEHAFRDLFTKTFKMDLPAPTVSTLTQEGLVSWVAPHQWFVEATDHNDFYYDHDLREIFSGTASVTLQSDAWVQVEISGANSLSLFERLLLIDLSKESFPPGRVARTSMHHMNIIIIHSPAQEGLYKMYCARSYAQSFLHSITHTAKTITALSN